jgi:type II secretory pathway pseudopilin PulG
MKRQRGSQRRGFALLSVMLVAAILIVSAFMFMTQLGTESHITKTDALFKSALSQAEGGLSSVLAMVRTGTSPDATSWAQHVAQLDTLTFTGSNAEAGTSGAYVVTAAVATGADAPTKYLADTYPDPDNPTTRIEHWTGMMDIVAEGAVYPPAITAMLNGSSLADGYGARRAIKTRSQVYWTKTIAAAGNPAGSTTEFSVDYGVFTGGDLSIKGASSEWYGDVYAAGNAYIQKKTSVRGGEVYATGSITGNPPGTPHPNVPAIPFPEIDVAFMRSMATAYLAGTWPYNDTVLIEGSNPPAYYTNTSDPVKRAYYNVDALAADPTNTTYFKDPSAVYFIDGSAHLNAGALSGTIVINGDVFINGNITAGSGGGLPTIVAIGNVTKQNGCSTINGIVYTGGSFTGNGTATINGALIARKTVDMKGTLDIYYDTSLHSIVIGGTPPSESGDPVTDYNLTDIRLPALQTGRIWQEVLPD